MNFEKKYEKYKKKYLMLKNLAGGDQMHVNLDIFINKYNKENFLNYYNNLIEAEKIQFLKILMHKIFYLYINKDINKDNKNLLITNLNLYRIDLDISNKQILFSFFNYIEGGYNKNKEYVNSYLLKYGITDKNIKNKLKSYSSSNMNESLPMLPHEFTSK